jgi:RHS repeat-associated protein
MDPVAICDEYGDITQRFEYSPFGRVSFMDADFTPDSTPEPWDFLFHGEFRDAATGYYNYGYRFYNDTTGRWLSRDPVGEAGGINLYGFVGNDGIDSVDILGNSIAELGIVSLSCNRCCLKSFKINWEGFTGGKSNVGRHNFSIEAIFEPYGRKIWKLLEGMVTCDPDLCKVDQYVRGTWVVDGKPRIPFKSRNTTVWPDRFSNDGYSIKDLDPSPTRYYSTDAPGLDYSDVNLPAKYSNSDLSLEFGAEVTDLATSEVLAKREYWVKVHGVISGTIIFTTDDGKGGFDNLP